MSYVGGKNNGAEHILQVLNHEAFDGMHYIEPFVGYAHILRRVVNKRTYAAGDDNCLLVMLLQAVQAGTKIPAITSQAIYDAQRRDYDAGRPPTLKQAVAAFTYSYNGKMFAGYTPSHTDRDGNITRVFHEERRRYYERLRAAEPFQRATIRCVDYEAFTPRANAPPCLIYCDPPYADTLGYGRTGTDAFDHERFWKVVRQWSKRHVVFVSEYTAPPDFFVVAERYKHLSLTGKGSTEVRTERLFAHPSCDALVARLVEKAARRSACAQPGGRSPRSAPRRSRSRRRRASPSKKRTSR